MILYLQFCVKLCLVLEEIVVKTGNAITTKVREYLTWNYGTNDAISKRECQPSFCQFFVSKRENEFVPAVVPTTPSRIATCIPICFSLSVRLSAKRRERKEKSVVDWQVKCHSCMHLYSFN